MGREREKSKGEERVKSKEELAVLRKEMMKPRHMKSRSEFMGERSKSPVISFFEDRKTANGRKEPN